jgi:hypothetical protein
MKKSLVLALIVITVAAIGFQAALSAETRYLICEEATAKFYVTDSDTGKGILSGLDGVKRVESGTEEGKEFNTVYYDPNVITEGEMVDALKAQDVYVGTTKVWFK